ncbi:MAG: 1-acyl-sn-glycerol-3-phosphate acyltransferase [Verrucomicrobiales bacterium]|nr:1-acyl-sn-glycerol-3-phosphate acyltransferase [Verrucomicrobiales bacterium]
MLDFSDAPYQFFPATPSRFCMALGKFVNRRLILPGKNHRISEIDLGGEVESFRELSREKKRLLIVANHPTHSDPQVMTEIHRRLGISSCFMAAYDVFLRGKRTALLMQKMGCFSIDREGSDRKSMAEATRILKEGEFPLTIFPEGNVYLTNDRVTPFLDGASFLSLKCQKDLGEDGEIFAVPVSFKYSHLTDVRPEIRVQLDEVAAAVGTEFDHQADPVTELKRIGRELLIKNLRQRGFIDPGEITHETESMTALLVSSVEKILIGLEKKIDLTEGTGSDATDRIRKIRSAIHQILSDPEKEIDHRVATTWADEAILAFRILQYAAPYVVEKPTVDRFTETVERLREDLSGKWQAPTGPRIASVRIGEAVSLKEVLSNSAKLRDGVTDLSRRLETAVQAGVDESNRHLETVGTEPFSG